MTHWVFNASPAFWTGAVGAVIATAVLSGLQWRRRGGGWRIAALETLRLLAVAMAALTLLQPERVEEIRHADPPRVVVLTDRSRSMETRDVVTGDNVSSRAEWLDQAGAFEQPLKTQGEVDRHVFAAPPAGDAGLAGTDLQGALEAVLRQNDNLRAVLLVTDGDWNTGGSPAGAATKFRARGVPIYSVGVGSETPLPDLILERSAKPSYGLLGEQISIPVHLQSHLPHEVRTTVTLENAGVPVASKTITIPAEGQLQDSIVWTPLEAGEYTLTTKLPVEPDEALRDNNDETFRIGIRSETLEVLLVDSVPRWEYRYLRNALVRDPGVHVQTLLLHPGMKPGEGRDYLSAFPRTKELLSKFDVIFLGDIGVGEGELATEDLAAIRGVVEQQGTGLIFLPGIRGRELTLAQSPIGDLLPVEFDAAHPTGFGSSRPSQLVLTEEGRGHLLTMLAADEATNASLWKSLPGFYWCAPVARSRAGAQVLAVHSTLRTEGGRTPLLVTRASGNGKVLFMGTDSAWRWRRGVEDKYHYRFWGQVVRWMAHQRHLAGGEKIRLSFDPEAPRVGDQVQLLATVFDAGGFPISKGDLEGKVTAPSGATEQLDFTGLEGGWGVFRSELRLRESGVHKLTVRNRAGGQELQTEIFAAVDPVEKLGRPANFGSLRELAAITGGASGPVAELSSIVEQIRLLPQPKPLERRLAIWCQWWWGAALLALLAGYWTARKFMGMV